MPDDNRKPRDNPELQARMQEFLGGRLRLPSPFADALNSPVPQALIDAVMRAPKPATRKWWRFGW